MKTFKMTKEEYGNSYPFSISPVKIINPKRTKELYVVFGSTRYKLNGIAKKGLQLEEIWLKSIDIPGTRKSIGFIFGICKNRGF